MQAICRKEPGGLRFVKSEGWEISKGESWDGQEDGLVESWVVGRELEDWKAESQKSAFGQQTSEDGPGRSG